MRIMTDKITIFEVHFRMPSGVWACKLRAEVTLMVAVGRGLT